MNVHMYMDVTGRKGYREVHSNSDFLEKLIKKNKFIFNRVYF